MDVLTDTKYDRITQFKKYKNFDTNKNIRLPQKSSVQAFYSQS